MIVTYFWGLTRFWCGTNIHNSVYWLNWAMFDNKTISYVKYWVYPVKALKHILGDKIGSPNFQIRPLKPSHFSDVAPKGPQKGTKYSRLPGKNVQNPESVLLVVCICVQYPLRVSRGWGRGWGWGLWNMERHPLVWNSSFCTSSYCPFGLN